MACACRTALTPSATKTAAEVLASVSPTLGLDDWMRLAERIGSPSGFRECRSGKETHPEITRLLALVHAFLLQLMTPLYEALQTDLLHHWAYRTAKRSREVQAPLDH